MSLPPWFIPMTDAAPEPEADPRIHRAAHDPDFPAKREAAFAAITAAVNRTATAQGFVARGQAWVRTGPQGTASLHLQRSRYGWQVEVNLGFLPANGTPSGIWAQDDIVPLGAFCDAAEDATLRYLDVLEAPAALEGAMRLLTERALPWLVAQLDPPVSGSAGSD